MRSLFYYPLIVNGNTFRTSRQLIPLYRRIQLKRSLRMKRKINRRYQFPGYCPPKFTRIGLPYPTIN